jgi:predicted small metal-binding protein
MCILSLIGINVHSHEVIEMKTMTCKELGGKCDQKLSAGSWEEMVKAMTKHVMEKHPDVAKEMEKMHNQDPKKWGKEMKPKWDAAPEV